MPIHLHQDRSSVFSIGTAEKTDSPKTPPEDSVAIRQTKSIGGRKLSLSMHFLKHLAEDQSHNKRQEPGVQSTSSPISRHSITQAHTSSENTLERMRFNLSGRDKALEEAQDFFNRMNDILQQSEADLSDCLGKSPAISQQLHEKLKKLHTDISIVEWQHDLETGTIAKGTFFILRELEKDPDIFRLQQLIAQPETALDCIKNILWYTHFPALAFIAFCGGSNVYSLSNLPADQQIVPIMASFSTVALMVSGAYLTIDFLSQIYQRSLGSAPLKAIRTSMQLFISIVISLWACGADPSTGYITGEKWSGPPLGWTFMIFMTVARTFLGIEGSYKFISNMQERKTGNNPVLEAATGNIIKLSRLFISGLQVYNARHGGGSQAALLKIEPQVLFKNIKEILLPSPSAGPLPCTLDAEQTFFREIARDAMKQHDMMTTHFMRQLLSGETPAQRDSNLMVLFQFTILAAIVTTFAGSFSIIFPATLVTNIWKESFGINTLNDTAVEFPVVEDGRNTNQTHLCLAGTESSQMQGINFDAAGSSDVLFHLFNLTSVLAVAGFWSSPYVGQGVMLCGYGLDMINRIFGNLKILTQIMLATSQNQIDRHESVAERARMASDFLSPIPTPRGLMADMTGGLLGGLFTSCYLINLAKSLPSAKNFLNVLSCVVTGEITMEAHLFAKLASTGSVCSGLFCIGSSIPVLMGGIHSTLCSFCVEKRIPAYHQRLRLMEAAEKEELVGQELLFNDDKTITDTLFRTKVKTLQSDLDLHELDTIRQAIDHMEPLQKNEIISSCEIEYELLQQGLQLKELFEDKIDTLSPEKFVTQALEVLCRYSQLQKETKEKLLDHAESDSMVRSELSLPTASISSAESSQYYLQQHL